MKVVRVEDDAGGAQFACVGAAGQLTRIEGAWLGQQDWTDQLRDTGQPLAPGPLLAPFDPVDILCIGLNYRLHAKETGKPLPAHPVVFKKSPAAVQHPGQPIELPRHLRSDQVDYEGELVVVIGRRCKNVAARDALNYVLGYTCGNDVSARDWQKQKGGGQFCRGKTFDTFAPLGPCLVTADEIPDPGALSLQTRLNGQVMQHASTEDLIFGIPQLIEFLSGSTTLLPGSAIFTGTPSGVGFARQPPRYLQPGDTVTVAIEGIGELTNPVVEEPAPAE